MFNRDTLFASPLENISNWEFDDRVAQVFPDMATRSIPGYSTIISMIGIMAKRFVTHDSNIYDLGCALGAIAVSVQRNIKVSGCSILAVDNSSAMLKFCSGMVKNITNKTPIVVIEDDVNNISIGNASLVILNFTLQFLEPEIRFSFLRKIWLGLNPGGALILSEKLSQGSQLNMEILSEMHHDFKRSNGYSELEIYPKSKMLEKSMITDNLEQHLSRLAEVGFSYIIPWFQCLNFSSLIVLK
jgi:tRNA (cmo5U34)-methyltransferase